MKKKVAAIVLSGILAGTCVVPVFAAPAVFTSGEEDGAEIPEIPEIPAARVEAGGVTYVYDSVQDAYVVQKGENLLRIDIKGEINGKEVTAIKEGAFANCNLLEYVTIPNEVRKIESHAFLGCYNLGICYIGGLYGFPEDGEIAPDAFEGVECMTMIESEETSRFFYISNFAQQHGFHFIYEPWLIGDVDGYAMYDLDGVYYLNLRRVVYCSRAVSGSVKIFHPFIDAEEDRLIREICHHAFHGCNKITEVNIPDVGLEKIGDYAFADCTSLRKITIPSSVNYISPTAFSGSNSVVIYAKKGSYAERYAKENKIPFKTTNATAMTAPDVALVKFEANSVEVTRGRAAENANGYQFAIGKSASSASKNQFYYKPTDKGYFYYVPKGTYYAFCRGVRTDDNGKKTYGPWSAGKKFSVTAVTPAQPKITKVSVSGKTVKITYTKCAGAIGYDVVLGKRVGSINGEKRPLDYGKLVQKAHGGSEVTVTFKNVPKGTYYVGLHAYNRSQPNRKKVFSPWSESKKITVR